MIRRVVVAGCALVVVASTLACQSIAGLADFHPDGSGTSGSGGDGQGGDGRGGDGPGRGGSGGQSGDGGGQGGGGAAAPATSTTTTSTGGGCALGHLVIAEVRTRGPEDGNQDFFEILNATASTVTLTSAFRVDVRGEEAGAYDTRWQGDGGIILAPGARALIANNAANNPLGGATADARYQDGIRDGASVVLYEGDAVVDAVCFTCEAASLDGFICEGAPFERPASCAADGDTSVQRGADGCGDTDDNARDLVEAPSTPQGNG